LAVAPQSPDKSLQDGHFVYNLLLKANASRQPQSLGTVPAAA
jgi:hypothetical protein